MATQNQDTPAFRPRQIAEFIAGDTGRTPMHASAINELVHAINAFLKLQVVQGQDSDPKVVWSDNNVLVELPQSAGGDGTGNMNYRGFYDPTATYNTNDVVVSARGSVSSQFRVLWICQSDGLTNVSPLSPDTGGWRCISRGMIHMGQWNPNTAYEIGDLVWDYGATNSIRIPYIALANNSGIGSRPRWPDTSGPWQALASPGGGGLQQYSYLAMQGDYIVCTNGTTDPNTGNLNQFKVAKPYKLRFSITSATVYGDSITYDGYSTGSDNDANNQRSAHDSAGDETQVIVPEYLPGDPIYVATVDHTGVMVDDPNNPGTQIEVTLLDVNADGRAWAKVPDQS